MKIGSVEDNLCELKVQGSKYQLISLPDNNKKAWQYISILSGVRCRILNLVSNIDLCNLHILLVQDSSGDEEDEDLVLESSFPTVIQTEIEETVVPPEQDCRSKRLYL